MKLWNQRILDFVLNSKKILSKGIFEKSQYNDSGMTLRLHIINFSLYLNML